MANANKDRCEGHDFVTTRRCILDRGHPPFHRLVDGTAFGISYTPAEAAQWHADQRPALTDVADPEPETEL